MEGRYITRPLAGVLKGVSSKVVILEGARAVGKTMMMKRELVSLGYHYFTLADTNMFRIASRDVESWVADLPTPAVIDEAQRIPDLPLAVKERVDGMAAEKPVFILTGSASINRKGLDGQNPLTRRSRRLTLHPFTQRELAGTSRSIVDCLWNGTLNEAYRGIISKDELRRRMSIGGFPGYAANVLLMSENERSLRITSDIDNVLGDTILPEEHLDKAIAQVILQELLALPGGILNVSRLASELHYDSRTIERYISIFMRRFLVSALPNLRSAAHKQTIARSKIHPVDCSLTMNAFRRAGKELPEDPSLFGGALESFVVNQILPETQWSEKKPECFYWREPGKNPKEVDLVLLRDHEMIGIEVKSAGTVRSDDFEGLRKLARDDRFMRGFVVYTGERFIKEDDNLWAMPITALWQEDAFIMEKGDQSMSVSLSAYESIASPHTKEADASIFLSYNHQDNEHLDGAIVQFAKEVVKEYEFQFGSSITLFTDMDSIAWGEDWQKKLDQSLEATNFIMPAITPRYLRSDACRDELTSFYRRTENSPNSMILSLIWQNADRAGLSPEKDIVYDIVKRHQYIEVEDLQDLTNRDREYKKRVKEIVKKLRQTVESSLQGSESAAVTAVTKQTEPAEEGLFEHLARVTFKLPAFQAACDNLVAKINGLTTTMNANPVPVSNKPAAFVKWSADIESLTRADLIELNKELSVIKEIWLDLYDLMREAVEAGSLLPSGSSKSDFIESLEKTLEGIRQSSVMPPETREVEAQLQVIQSLSPRLRPLASGWKNVFASFGSIHSMAEDLLQRAELVK